MGVWAERLIGELQDSQTWPLDRDRRILEELAVHIAFRESDRQVLAQAAATIGFTNLDPYLIDPLPQRIPEAWASLLYGEEPKVTPSDEGDEELMLDIIEANRLAPALQRSVKTSSSEGEVWWRTYINRELAEVPLIEWYSRTAVVPLYVGQWLKAAAFVSHYPAGGTVDKKPASFRHFEVHDKDEILNVLFYGNDYTLGSMVGLEQFHMTEDLEPEWFHGLGEMMCGRIINREGVDPTLGVSDYGGIQDYLFMLNEALTITKKNVDLTARKKITVPASALEADGSYDASKEVLIMEAASETLGQGDPSAAPYKVIEYSFDEAGMSSHRRNLTEEALTRIGISPQFVGMGGGAEGLGASGTALRVRLLPTVAAGRERGQFQDEATPKILRVTQLLDAMDFDGFSIGGFGRPWTDPETAPAVERGDELPKDQNEEVSRHAEAKGARIESTWLAVRELHPEWPEEQVDEEVGRIREDEKISSGTLFGDFGNFPEDEETEGEETDEVVEPEVVESEEEVVEEAQTG